MTAPLFVAISDAQMANYISHARERVALATPGFGQKTADAIVAAAKRIGHDRVFVVADCDEEVFRLGYGHIDALNTVTQSGQTVGQSSRLRIGILICDNYAWSFAPTALYVESEVHSDETPNAISLSGEDVDRILVRIVPKTTRKEIVTSDNTEVETAEVEVGLERVSSELLANTQEALAQAPPIPFDVARQVRVFEPYIQYVEINLKGCHIERRTVELPKSIQGLDPYADLSSRLHTTFDLIEKSSGVSSAQMEAEVKQLREQTKSLGRPWGRVLLRSNRPEFDQHVAEIRRKLDKHKAKAREELTTVLKDSRERLIKHFHPLVKTLPPPKLLSQITNNPPTDAQIDTWLDMQLDRTIPKEEDLMSDMSLDVQFRDVTYETLKQDGFAEKLRQAYPMVDWDKPFTEFNAAEEREA